MTLPPENEITPKELFESRKEFFVVDVREAEEREFCNIKEDLFLPLGELQERFSEIPINKPVVMLCRSGARSESAAKFLMKNGYTDVKNLVGGILRWSDDVDPTVKKY